MISGCKKKKEEEPKSEEQIAIENISRVWKVKTVSSNVPDDKALYIDAIVLRFNTDLSYQLSDDTEYQKLTGSFSENRNFPRSIDFKLSYTNGTRTAQYAVDITKLNLVDIKTTAISGNQHFVLTDLNDKGEAITPILSAEDGSNLTLAFDNAGAATLSLRNDSGGKVITTKSYSKAEIDDLIVGARRAKK